MRNHFAPKASGRSSNGEEWHVSSKSYQLLKIRNSSSTVATLGENVIAVRAQRVGGHDLSTPTGGHHVEKNLQRMVNNAWPVG